MSSTSNPRITLLRGNDQVLELPGLRTAPAGVYLNAATVSAVLWTTGTGAAIVLTISMLYVASSDGVYQGGIEGSTFLSPAGDAYELVVTAVEAGQNYRIVYGVDVRDTALQVPTR